MDKTDEQIMAEVNEAREKEDKPKLRRIIIETDGNSLEIKQAEVAGNFELIAILEAILNKLK